MPGTSQQALQTVATGTRFVAKAEPPIIPAEPSDHSAQNLRSVLKYTDLSHLAVTAALSHGHAYRRLVHIQANKGDIVHLARPPCMRLCAGHSAQPSTLYMPRAGRRSLSGHRVYTLFKSCINKPGSRFGLNTASRCAQR